MARQQRRSLVRRLFTRKPGSDPDEAGRSQALEIMIAIVLGAAAVMTAYAAFKVDLLDGDTLKGFQEGSALYDDANQQYLEGTQQVQTDLNLFKDYAIAREKGDDETAVFIRDNLMDGTLPAATEEWEGADGDIPSAIEAESYKVPAYDKAEELVAEGDKNFDEANVKDKQGDKFTLATVVLAVALFFGGVAGVTRSHLISVTMTVFSLTIVAAAGIYMTTI